MDGIEILIYIILVYWFVENGLVFLYVYSVICSWYNNIKYLFLKWLLCLIDEKFCFLW